MAGTIDLEPSFIMNYDRDPSILFLGLRINMLNKQPTWSPVVSGDQYLLWDACLVINTSSGTPVWWSIPPLGRLAGDQYLLWDACLVFNTLSVAPVVWLIDMNQTNSSQRSIVLSLFCGCFTLFSDPLNESVAQWRCGLVFVVTQWRCRLYIQ